MAYKHCCNSDSKTYPERTAKGWREVLIDIDPERTPEKTLRFVLAPGQTPASAAYTSLLPQATTHDRGSDGEWCEVCPEGLVLAKELASRVMEDGGAALIADYGEETITKNTLRGFKQHALHDVLESPGDVDLTADMDFGAIKRAVLTEDTNERGSQAHDLSKPVQKRWVRDSSFFQLTFKVTATGWWRWQSRSCLPSPSCLWLKFSVCYYVLSIPDVPALEVLRECILLLYTWNKSTPALQPISDGILSLLFKVLTAYIQSPTSPLPEKLQTELSGDVPEDKHPNLLTLTRAAHLQGFLSGLSTASLPESFQRGMPPRIRPHVQSKYCSLDPYSPLTLVVPEGLSPPWRDCFVEGQKDVLHGGALSKALMQNAKLKQCSRCRSWTLASEGLQSEQLSLSVGGGHPVQQWTGRTAWTNSCLCGGPWILGSSKQT